MLELGRGIERALQTRRFERAFVDEAAPNGGLDVILELADGALTYKQRYVVIAALAPVIDLVMLDPNNPRTVAYQIDRIENHLAAVPTGQPQGRLSPVQPLAASIATTSATPTRPPLPMTNSSKSSRT